MRNMIDNQPIEELVQLLITIQDKEKTKCSMVLKFQNLVRNEGLSSLAIQNFPYPMTVYFQDGTLAVVNRAFSAETGLFAKDLGTSECCHNILNRITDANLSILDAVDEVFVGKQRFYRSCLIRWIYSSAITRENEKHPFNIGTPFSFQSTKKPVEQATVLQYF